METTIEEIIDQLNQRVNVEHTTVDNRLNAMRRDFETEATKMKKQLVNLGEAASILASEASRAPANSTLSLEVHNRIMALLNS